MLCVTNLRRKVTVHQTDQGLQVQHRADVAKVQQHNNVVVTIHTLHLQKVLHHAHVAVQATPFRAIIAVQQQVVRHVVQAPIVHQVEVQHHLILHHHVVPALEVAIVHHHVAARQVPAQAEVAVAAAVAAEEEGKTSKLISHTSTV